MVGFGGFFGVREVVLGRLANAAERLLVRVTGVLDEVAGVVEGGLSCSCVDLGIGCLATIASALLVKNALLSFKTSKPRIGCVCG